METIEVLSKMRYFSLIFALVTMGFVNILIAPFLELHGQELRNRQYLSEPFDTKLENIGEGFSGHNAQDIYNRMLKVAEAFRKDEFETNDQNGRAWSTESSMSVKPDVVAANFYFIDNESATNSVPKPNHQITEVNDPIGFSKRWLTERLTNYVWRSNSTGYYDGKPYNMTERITLFEFSGCVLRLEWENNFSWLAEKWEKDCLSI